MCTPAGLSRWTFAACLIAVAGAGAPASAQSSTARKWEIEFNAGGLIPSTSTTGVASLPGPGEPFTTAGLFPPPAPQVVVQSTSRRESSWYFGDGALLFNQAAASIAASTVAMTAAFAGRVTALDPVLGRALGAERSGASLGVRVSRILTPRLAVEVSVGYGLTRLEIAPQNRDAVEATRASFIAAFNGLITANPSRTLRSLTSTATLDGGDARPLVTTGAVLVNLRTSGRAVPYATAGVSLITLTGRRPSVVLKGNYQFANPSGSPIDESDTVHVWDAREDRSVAGMLGGGVKYHLSSRWGLRLDTRVALTRNPSRTTLDADPHVTLGLSPAGRGLLNAAPTIQFSNSTEPVTTLGVTAVAASTLTGPALASVRTWSGSGVAHATNIAAGVFWRF
jgi:hypothetical protein